MDLQKYTSEKLVNLYNRIIARWYDQADGGTQFGIDWPTARINWPLSHALAIGIRVEMVRRLHA